MKVAPLATVAQVWQINHRELEQCLVRRQECCRNRQRGWAGGSPDMAGLSCSHKRSGACLRRIPPEKACYLHRHLLAARFAAVAAKGGNRRCNATRVVVLPVSSPCQSLAEQAGSGNLHPFRTQAEENTRRLQLVRSDKSAKPSFSAKRQ